MLSIPKADNKGEIKPAVVVIATVEEPCADFKIAETIKGKKMPIEHKKISAKMTDIFL